MTNQEQTHSRPQAVPSLLATWLLFAAIFAAVQFASLFTPPLMDDVDAAHAEAAQHMAESGNLITSKINGIRYIEKPPLPYWIVAGSYRLFGQNTFATHLPNSLAMLGLVWLSWLWACRAWDARAGLYAGLGVLTSIGPFLFTRFIIPEAELSLFLLLALYGLIIGLELKRPRWFYWTWAGVALALLTKGFIAPVFFAGAAIPYLILTGQWRLWRKMKPVTGLLLFLAIAAPWHILCGLANPDQGHPVGNHPTLGNVHGFLYFYFVNEHFLRFFSLRYPHDYNKLPFAAYWLLHLVWLFPWSLFLPALLAVAWKTRHQWRRHLRDDDGQAVDLSFGESTRLAARGESHILYQGTTSVVPQMRQENRWALAPEGWFSGNLDCNHRLSDPAGERFRATFRARSIWLLSLFTAWTLFFFSLSSNQEYYTFPVWPPFFILVAGLLVAVEEQRGADFAAAGRGKPLLSTAWLTGAQAVFAVIGVLAAAVLGWGLWDSRNLPYVADIGTLLAHRAVAGYTLSMSHFFDLTGASFAALRLPAALAAIALLIGPSAGWLLRLKGKHVAATVSLALTMSVFLIAAHIAFARFDPMLGSKQLADVILQEGTPADSFIIYGEQSDASSVIFYTHNFFHQKPAYMVVPRCGLHGEGSTLLWGSCYPDAPNIFFSEDQLSKAWGTGERKWLFAQDVNQTKAEQLLAGRLYLAKSIADKALWTDRPLQ